MENYSDAFSKFVTGTEDLEGMIAYGLYKQQKREFIIRNSLPPEDTRVKKYHFDLNDLRVDLLKKASRDMLDNYAEAVLEVAAKDMQKDVVEGTMLDEVKNQFDSYSKLVDKINTENLDMKATISSGLRDTSKEIKEANRTITEATSFWKSMWVGILSNTAFGLVLTIASILFWSNPFNIFTEPPKKAPTDAPATPQRQ